jgi:hypothetical protein
MAARRHAAHHEPAVLQADVLDQQVNQFARAQARSGEREVDGEGPAARGREERQLPVGVEHEDPINAPSVRSSGAVRSENGRGERAARVRTR